MHIEATERVCTKCRQLKPLDDFSHAPRGKYGRKSSCKACDAARHAELFPPKPRVGRPRRPPLVGGDPKLCTKCGEVKTVDEFSVTRQATATRNAVYRSDCKRCQSDKALAWFRANPGRAAANRRRFHLQSLYGLSIEQYEAMEAKQDFACAICRKAAQLCVDHDHETGAVRGLLCHRCNRAMGLFGDDAMIMHSAMEYLQRAEQIHQRKG